MKGQVKVYGLLTEEQLFDRYPCVLTTTDNHLKYYIMFQFREQYNKISLICHDSTADSKEGLMKLLRTLLYQPGYILEDSGAVSWVLRKRTTPIIESQSDIEKALDISPDTVHDKIVMNLDFDPDNKYTQQYTREFTDREKGITCRTPETLFGIAPCEYKERSCDRVCPDGMNVHAGGMNERYKRLYKKYKHKYKYKHPVSSIKR